MAGKLYVDWALHDAAAEFNPAASPFGRGARAYAEGYKAQVAGLTIAANPHAGYDAQLKSKVAWDHGFTDADNGRPNGHVGLPDGVAPPPPPEGKRSRKKR